MRLVLVLLIASAAIGTVAIGNAQWRHFGAEPPSFGRDMLAVHNSVRSRVGVAPLVWSDRLASVARDWAATLLARRQFSHRPNTKFGENLFEIDGAFATPGQVLNTWAEEARGYDYTANKCRGVCGHYTQIVWSTTREVGCAVARGGTREVWVCNYDPPGNWVGKRPY